MNSMAWKPGDATKLAAFHKWAAEAQAQVAQLPVAPSEPDMALLRQQARDMLERSAIQKRVAETVNVPPKQEKTDD